MAREIGEASFTPRLSIVEQDGHGRAFEVYEDGAYVATFDGKDGAGYRPYPFEDWNGHTLTERFGGRIALVYGYEAYEAACAVHIAEHPDDWDCSDIVPAPVLAMVRTEVKL